MNSNTKKPKKQKSTTILKQNQTNLFRNGKLVKKDEEIVVPGYRSLEELHQQCVDLSSGARPFRWTTSDWETASNLTETTDDEA